MVKQIFVFLGVIFVSIAVPFRVLLAAEGARVIEEVVVTARRREESLQEVPVSVTAFSSADMEARQITHLEDVEYHTPSLEFMYGGFRKNTPGAVQRGIFGSGFNVTEDTSTGFYYNDVIFLRPHGQNQALFDIESIQVLNGPQGTLFGKNTMGGAILFNYNKPQTDRFEAQVDGLFGNFSRADAHGMINIPVTDTFAIRANLKTANNDGYTRVLNMDNRRQDDEEALAWRVSALFDNGGFANHFIYSGVRSFDNASTQIVIPLDPSLIAGNPFAPLILANMEPQRGIDLDDSPRDVGGLTYPLYSKTKTWDVTNTTEWEISDNLTLKNIVSYRDIWTDDRNDFDGGEAFHAHSIQTEDGWQVSEEIQLQGENGSLTWVAGFFYIKEKTEEWSRQDVIACCTTQGGFAKNDHQAVFAQGTYDLSEVLLDGLSFTAGIRQNWDTKRFTAYNYRYVSYYPVLDTTFVSCSIANTATGQPLGDSYATCNVPQKESWSDPTWTVGVEYQITDNIMTYFTSRRGIRTGRVDRRITKFPEDIENFAGPEQGTDFEFGIKADWSLGNVPVRSNVAVYRMKYKDKQQTVSVTSASAGIVTDIVNTGRDEIDGVEVQLTVSPTERLTIDGWYSYTDHTIEVVGVPGMGGPELVDVNERALEPQHRGGVTVSYVQPLSGDNGELSFAVSASFRDGDPGGGPNGGTPAFPREWLDQPSRQLYNARLDWLNVLGTNLDLGIWGRNLGNETYGIADDVFSGSFGGPTTPVIALYPPRTYGASFAYRFGQ